MGGSKPNRDDHREEGATIDDVRQQVLRIVGGIARAASGRPVVTVFELLVARYFNDMSNDEMFEFIENFGSEELLPPRIEGPAEARQTPTGRCQKPSHRNQREGASAVHARRCEVRYL